jgi:ubiquinone/menaquinone biosynthesis C-methylase UbiE
MSALRKPHVTSNNRFIKAQKIESIIQLNRLFKRNDFILEVGTGSGGIANYFSHNSDMNFNIKAIDVVDSRVLKEGYEFQIVNGTKIPFSNESFDVIITNHVIEHVGGYENQLEHLNEIKRLLKKNGIAYLAVPNRWMLIEPHYELIFLSWLPSKYRSKYLKKMRNIEFYDCEPLEKKQLEDLFNTVGFSYENQTIQALRVLLHDEKEQHRILSLIFSFIPNFLLKLFLGITPTLIYTIRIK